MGNIKIYLKKLFKIINKTEMKILPGQVAFFLLISLIPSITLFGVICSIFSISTTDIFNMFANVLPKSTFEMLEPFINQTLSGHSILIYFFIGFVLASNGPHSMVLTSNILYGIEQKSYLEHRIKAFLLTIILMFIFAFTLVVLAFGNIIVKMIFELEILNNVSDIFYHLFVYLKWPVAFLLLFIGLKLIYTMTPDKKILSKTTTKGSLFTTIGWLFVTAIYSYYANNIAHYDLFYGSLSNVAILMMWIYILSYIFVIGIIINANSYKFMEENTSNKN